MDFFMEQQITSGLGGRILTNCNVWSPDGQWIVYDTRSDRLGERFDGTRIAMVHVGTGETRTLYESQNGACCGVATFNPQREQVVFILGPEHPTSDWQYSASHRQGVLADIARPGGIRNLDARDIVPPFTPGALRGGSHVHVFSPDGQCVSFTYNDAVLASGNGHAIGNAPHIQQNADTDQRNVGVCVPVSLVQVPASHPRNHDGAYFAVLATRTTSHPSPGSDDITLAREEGWIGTHGYLRPDGTRQHRALASQGHVTLADGGMIAEVFVCDLPDDMTVPAPDGPLEGTATTRPLPPLGTTQRRITHTQHRLYPGIQGPRHWLRCSPDGAQIAFLMRDDTGIVQIYTVSPNGGEPRQITRDAWNISSAFTWSADGQYIAYAADNSVFCVHAAAGVSRRLTPRVQDHDAPLPLACVFSPNDRHIAYMRPVLDLSATTNSTTKRSSQIFVTTL